MTTINAPESIHLGVEYWSPADKESLAKLPVAHRIEQAVASGVDVYYGDFLAYATFSDQSDAPHHETFQQLQSKLVAIQPYFELHYGAKSGTLRATSHQDAASRRSSTEMAGVASALTIAGHIYDLNQADWQRIPECRHKTLDYRYDLRGTKYASDGERFIEVESKAAKVDNVEAKIGLHAAAKSIREKKRVQRQLDDAGASEAPVDRIGVITALPGDEPQIARCWLLDPPSDANGADPERYRLLARMTYYWKALSMVSRSPMLLALYSRIEAIRYADNWRAFDGIDLASWQGKPMSVPASFESQWPKPGNIDGFGTTIRLTGNTWFYYGFDREVILMLLQQRFSTISTFSSHLPRSVQALDTVIEAQRDNRSGEKRRRPGVPISCKLYASGDGRIFGVGKTL